MSEGMNVDVMSILIEKDKESEDYVDYFYASNIYTKDPRGNSRNICLGNVRGLFRITKVDLEAHLLLPIEHDSKNGCFLKASRKVIKQFKTNNKFPNKTSFQSG
ncbi:hypothetical protein KFE80_00395 [bacterium SCSIO 12696]|nr:hypothetical protein KFE80_00395 [bacterium SCSIO 12696]